MSLLDSLLQTAKQIADVVGIKPNQPTLRFLGNVSVTNNAGNNSTDVSITNANLPPDSVLALRSSSPAASHAFQPRDSYQAQGDNGGRFWVWAPTDTRADDGLTVLQVTSPPTSTGRWDQLIERYICLDGVVQPGSIVHDGAITSGQNLLTCGTSQPFTLANVGDPITVLGAGAAGATLVTTIASFVSASQVHLTANAGSTVTSNADVVFGPDNTSIINNAIATASSAIYVRTAILLPRGVTCVASKITIATNGIMLVGDCRQRGSNTTADASILALVGSQSAVMNWGGAHHRIADIWFHGGNVATQTLELTDNSTPGVGPFTESSFENVTCTNSAPVTGICGYTCTGTLQVNKIRFHNCNFRQDPVGTLLNGTTENRAASAIKNANANAFEISHYDCIFQSTGANASTNTPCIDLRCGSGTFAAGGAYFYSCEFYDYTGPICGFECCRHTTFLNCYTELGSYPWLQEYNNFPNFSFTEAVVCLNTEMATGGAAISLQPKQPVYLQSCGLAGWISVLNQPGTPGRPWPVFDNCGFLPLDYAIAIINTAIFNDGVNMTTWTPERVILKHGISVLFQTTPGSAFLPVISVWDHDPSQGWVSPLPYGAYGNARTSIVGVTHGSTSLDVADMNFLPSDVERNVILYSESAAIRWASYQILAVNSSTNVTLSGSPAAATGVIVNLGGTNNTTDTLAILNAANAASAGGYELRFPPGIHMTATNALPAGVTYSFSPNAYILLTGAGASGGNLQINGKMVATDGHNPILGQVGPTTLVSSSFANNLYVTDEATAMGKYALNVTGNFGQEMDSSGFGASNVTLTDTGSVLTSATTFTWPAYSDVKRVFSNQTAKTITVLAIGATTGGYSVAAGKRQQIYFDPLAGSALSGTVTLVNTSPTAVFSTNQTLAQGSFVVFSAQPGVPYQLKNAVGSSTVATLTAGYSGHGSSTATTTAGADFFAAGALA